MANLIQWGAAWTSRSTVLTTELNSLANGSRTAAGTEFNNGSYLDEYACLEIYLASLTPTTGGFLTIYMVTNPDQGGSNYSEGDASTDPGSDTIVGSIIPLRAATGTVRKVTRIFSIPPCKFKFILKNDSGAALASSGNTVTLYTANEEIQ